MAEIILTGSCGDNATFNLYDDGLLEILGTGEMKGYNEYPYNPWWTENNKIARVTIADGITSIGVFSFYNCTNLTDVRIGNGVTSMTNAFWNCTSLTTITMPASVTRLVGPVFDRCSKLSQVIIENKTGVVDTTVPPFTNTPIASLQGEIIVPYNLKDSYKTDTNWTVYTTIIKTEPLARLFKKIATAIRKVKGTTDNIVAYDFPEEINEVDIHDMTNIWDSGEVVISHGTVPKYAFYNDTQIKKVIIGEGVTSINTNIFNTCSNLATVVYNATNVTLTNNAGAANQLFYNCPITSITFGENVLSIPNYLFWNYNNRKTFPDTITIPDSVTSIGNYAFYYCTGLTSITIGNSVTSIGDWVFRYCTTLTSVTIGNGVTSISLGAFSGCTGLTSITIPDSVTSIGNSAFSNCTGLTELILKNADNVVALNSTNALLKTPIQTSETDGFIYVPEALVEQYKGDTNWATYADKIKAIGS